LDGAKINVTLSDVWQTCDNEVQVALSGCPIVLDDGGMIQ